MLLLFVHQHGWRWEVVVFGLFHQDGIGGLEEKQDQFYVLKRQEDEIRLHFNQGDMLESSPLCSTKDKMSTHLDA